jgi:hypothetical protein
MPVSLARAEGFFWPLWMSLNDIQLVGALIGKSVLVEHPAIVNFIDQA